MRWKSCKGSPSARRHTPPAKRTGLVGFTCTRCGDFIFSRMEGVDVDAVLAAGDAAIDRGDYAEAQRIREAAINGAQ